MWSILSSTHKCISQRYFRGQICAVVTCVNSAFRFPIDTDGTKLDSHCKSKDSLLETRTSYLQQVVVPQFPNATRSKPIKGIAFYSTKIAHPRSGTEFPNLLIKSPQGMQKLGAILSEVRQKADVICLDGDLGVGKSCLARGFVRQFLSDPDAEVPSPTFLIDQVYDADIKDHGISQQSPSLHHMDFYRFYEDMSSAELADNVHNLQLQHAFKHDICLIEWSARLRDWLPLHALHVHILYEWDTVFEEDIEMFDTHLMSRRVIFQDPLPESWSDNHRLEKVFRILEEDNKVKDIEIIASS